MKKILLAGPPNCGKSALFSLLTGSYAQTGNREGVTVGAYGRRASFGGIRALVTDLPGIRVIPPRAPDERISCDAVSEGCDVIMFVFNASEPGRGLSLLLDLIGLIGKSCGGCVGNCVSLPCRFIIVGNMSDKASQNPEIQKICNSAGIPYVSVSCRTLDGINALKTLLAGILAGVTDKSVIKNLSEFQAVIKSAVAKTRSEPASPASSRGKSADRILTSPLTGYPVLLSIIFFMLYCAFGYPGTFLSELIGKYISAPVLYHAEGILYGLHAPVFLVSLVTGGILPGVFSVISFLPRLIILFFFISVTDGCGYSSRAAVLTDSFMRRAGLSGQAFIPMLIGFGCTVPAVLSTRTCADCRTRRRTSTLLPLISCSARAAIYSTVSDAFFPDCGWLIIIIIYILTFAAFYLSAFIMFKVTGKKCDSEPPVLPEYTFPSFSSVAAELLDKAAGFVTRVGSVILLTSVLVWLASHVTPGFAFTYSAGEGSLLYAAGKLLSYPLKPLGFGKPELAASLLAGIGAKESAVATLGVLLGKAPIADALSASGMLDSASALSFCVFSSLYFPCTATLSAIKSEAGVKSALASCIICLATAYALSGAVYAIARIFI